MVVNAADPLAQIQEQRQVSEWEFFTMKDAYEDRGVTQYAIEGLFALPSLSIVYGAPGSFKSLLMADAAMCVAIGRRWLQPRFNDKTVGFDVGQFPAMWLDFDNGTRVTHEHFDALGHAYGVPEDAPVFYASMPNPLLNASLEHHMKDLTDLVRSHDVKFLVLDNLGRISGGLDENSNAMDKVMQGLRYLAENTGAAVVVIHHQRKRQDAAGRPGDALRGHSSIEAALDLALHVIRNDRARVATVKATKVRGPEVADFGVLFDFTHQGNTRDLKTAGFVGTIPELHGKEAAIASRALELLDSDEMKKTDLINKIAAIPGIGVESAKSVLDKLVKRGILTVEQRREGRSLSIWYSRSPK